MIDGIIEGFEPRFKSIGKDSDRYFDALFKLSEDGIIETSQVVQLSGDGTLWITFQYIEKRLLDLVESDLLGAVASRDFYGPLFENTRLILERLVEISEEDRVISLYRAAIIHRLKALKSEAAIRDTSKNSDARAASASWVKHYLPAVRSIMTEYRELLQRLDRTDPELDTFEETAHALS